MLTPCTMYTCKTLLQLYQNNCKELIEKKHHNGIMAECSTIVNNLARQKHLHHICIFSAGGAGRHQCFQPSAQGKTLAFSGFEHSKTSAFSALVGRRTFAFFSSKRGSKTSAFSAVCAGKNSVFSASQEGNTPVFCIRRGSASLGAVSACKSAFSACKTGCPTMMKILCKS